ncbi:ABC transporter substrate-binding protein [Prosthecomicrobium sp. N25]|uniref:ABC transporter substrate-binding protein n=1 Tax=Prosthecomicrobium sp. N25 TaxID=3129254 RepID=UPI0030776E81
MRRITRRAAGAALAGAVVLASLPALAADKVSVGVLRFVSSGGLFLAVERGYFKDQGIDVDLKFFEAAQPIAVAIASGDIQFGVTALTAGTFNLAGKGALKVIASQGMEKKGVKGNALIASNESYAKGFTSFEKLPGTSIAITQVGSSFHYQMGQIAAAKGFDLAKIGLKPLQSLPNMVAAVKSGQVDGALIAPHIARAMIDKGEAKLVGWFSDVAEYQFGALFVASKVATENRDLTQRFVTAYQKGMADYAAAFLRVDGKGERVVDETAKSAAALVGKHVYPADSADVAAPKVIESAVAVDEKARIDFADIERQIAWNKAEKLVTPEVDAKAFVDTSFAK